MLARSAGKDTLMHLIWQSIKKRIQSSSICKTWASFLVFHGQNTEEPSEMKSHINAAPVGKALLISVLLVLLKTPETQFEDVKRGK